MNIFDRYSSIWLTAGLVVWIEGLATIEWTYPYCLDRSDGPAYAALGMPLPYWMWNGVVSLEHDFMPHVYILNLVIIGLVIFPVVRWLMSNRPGWLRNLLGAVGCVMVLAHVALTVILISVGFYRPVMSLALDGYYRYSDFRPVRVSWLGSNARECTPSPFWFPEGWKHD
jgi:hypothetical protein